MGSPVLLYRLGLVMTLVIEASDLASFPSCPETIVQPDDRTVRQSNGGCMMDEQKIKEAAYALWEKDGRPDGSDLEHWFKATSLIEGENAITPHTPDDQPDFIDDETDRVEISSEAVTNQPQT